MELENKNTPVNSGVFSSNVYRLFFSFLSSCLLAGAFLAAVFLAAGFAAGFLTAASNVTPAF